MANVTSEVRRALRAAMFTGMVAISTGANAVPPTSTSPVSVASTQGLTCAADRGATGCTAKDFTNLIAFVASNLAVSTCYNGEVLTVDMQATLTSSAERSDLGFFFGEAGNSPSATGGTCSVATFTSTPAPPWHLDNTDPAGDTCGDWDGANAPTSGGYTEQATITGVKILCGPTVGSAVQVPYMLAYAVNPTSACTGAGNVVPHPSSKCQSGSATLTNVSSTPITVTPAADLSVVKNLAISGNSVTYTLTITNNGPDAANGATYSDAVPNTVAISTATCGSPTGGAACGTQPNVAGQNVTGSVGALPNGGSVTITISGTAANNAVVDNTASVAPPSGTTDPTNGNNSSTATGTVGAASADVQMQKSVVFNSNSVTYTLVITNFGPAAADGATYSDAVPNTVAIGTANCGSPTGGANCGTQPNVAGQNVTGTVGTLPSGGSVTITITGTGATGANADNTADVQPPAGTNDPNNGNNSSTATGTIPGPSADVGVVKNVAILGITVTYTVVISNAGPDAADGESYTDNVPATVAIGTATCGSPTGGAVCATPGVSGQTVSGTVPTLPSGGSVTITISGTAANNAVVDNTVSILPPAGTTDPNNGNNSSTATGTVGGPVADVAVAKTVVISGNTVTYTLVVSNAGPNSADLASYTDNVPATVAISSAVCGGGAGGAACGTQPNVTGQTVSGTVSTLPSGGSVTITITGTAANGATVDNTASAVPPTGTTDSNNGNNSSMVTGTVGSSADLSMAKSVVISGTSVTYTLSITNNGPNNADGATYSDPVPATVTLVNESCAPVIACGPPTVAGNTVSGTITTFPAGSTVTVTITGTSTNGATVDNTATVTPPSGVSDPTPGNNTDTATGTAMPVRLQSFDVSFVPQPKPKEARLPR